MKIGISNKPIIIDICMPLCIEEIIMNPEEGYELPTKKEIAKDITKRIIAVFVASALGVLGAGAIVGVDVFQAAAMAGILGVANVIERLARAYLEDGKLTAEEVNAAFSAHTSEDFEN
jgi:hypothetical protein